MAVTLYWDSAGLDGRLAVALRTLGEEYPLREAKGAPRLQFASGADEGSVQVSAEGETVRIYYGALTDALRGVGAALAGLAGEGAVVSERRPFTTLGIMLDCSRNAVMTIGHLERWLRRLALFGFNMAMLYTEDTYRIDGEPFFGFLRGAYSKDELRRLDEYAARLGIEMIGCIQTLGHLEQILKWGAYREVRDTEHELLAGEPKTYQLIAKMVATFAECFRSRRLHIGMDETHTLGRGVYLDRHGKRRGFDILNEHLAEVTEICQRAGLRPMMWSDMFFRFGSKTGDYYDLEADIPEEVKTAIPSAAELVYWDYYHADESFYLRMIERHRQLGREPIMGSGVWTWQRLWHGRADTEANAGACVRACREAGLKELFFTMWGDDGGYCEFDSSLAGLAFVAAQSWGESEEALKRRYQAVCAIGYDETNLGAGIEDPTLGGRVEPKGETPACMILWDDPLLGIHWMAQRARQPGYWEAAREHLEEVSAALEAHRHITQPVDLGYGATLAKLLAAKVDFRLRLEAAYRQRDPVKLEALAAETAGMVELVEALEESFQRQWHRRNKPFGMEVIQIRLGGLRQRYLEVGRALRRLVRGDADVVPELEEAFSIPDKAWARAWVWCVYRRLATPSSIL